MQTIIGIFFIFLVIWAAFIYYRYELRVYKKGELVAINDTFSPHFKILGEIVNVDEEKRIYKVVWWNEKEPKYYQQNEIRRVFDNNYLHPPL